MKKAFLLLLFLFFGSICYNNLKAQDCKADFLGTKTLYKAPLKKMGATPVGYTPIFINHVGRHGARHLTKDVKTTSAYALLFQADSLNALTESGKKLKQMVISLQKVEKGNTKNISAEGRDELRGIAARMYANCPNIFNAKPELAVTITKEVRTEQSADAFLQGLNNMLKDTLAVSKKNDDVHLRFYDLSPAYKKFENDVDEGDVMKALKKENHLNEICNKITRRFFDAGFAAKMTETTRDKFVSDIFGFATIVYSLKEEIGKAGFTPAEVNIRSLFTCDELATLGMLDSIDEDLKKGPGTDNNGIQVRIAVPLLVDFINSTDEYLKTDKPNARLRFAHAETIAPFAALLRIAEADKATKQVSRLNAAWQASKVIPLSSNIQWIFYKRKKENDYALKILLNEQPVHITGLNAKAYPYYSWKELRTFYMKKLLGLGVKLSDDMNAYLKDLK